MKNRWKIDARKSDAEMMENERKWTPNGSPNPLKICKNLLKNEVQKSMRKKNGLPAKPGAPLGPKAT